ncbi:MAG: hypothetical protein QG650_1146, partial [Patescibacteria group bacterium]|nr:hypothetical protein [Patescibacteria group bacterium]
MSEIQRDIPAEAATETRKEADRSLSVEELRTKTLALSEGYSKRLDALPNLRPSDRERLRAEFKAFVLDSAANALSGSLSEYRASVADTDGVPGLDAYEFAKYSKGLEEAFRLVVEAGGVEKLRTTLGKFETEAKDSFFVKRFDLFSRHAPDSPDRPTNFVTEKYLEAASNLPPEETRRLLSAKLGEDPESFKKGLVIALGTKAPVEVFEIAGRFAYDAVKAVPQFA